jgi:hypothetical protein
MDILGYKAIVEDYDNGEKHKFEELKKAIDHAYLELDKGTDHRGTLAIKVFSDSIIASIKYDEVNFQSVFDNICIAASTYQRAMLQHGFLVRGGISYGSFYQDDIMMFSGALVHAYETEKKLQKLNIPLIGIDQRIIREKNCKPYPYSCVSVTKDESNFVCVNPFGRPKNENEITADFVIQSFVNQVYTRDALKIKNGLAKYQLKNQGVPQHEQDKVRQKYSFMFKLLDKRGLLDTENLSKYAQDYHIEIK